MNTPDPLSRARRLDVERPAIESYYPAALRIAMQAGQMHNPMATTPAQFASDLDRAYYAGRRDRLTDALWLAAMGVAAALLMFGLGWVAVAGGSP